MTPEGLAKAPWAEKSDCHPHNCHNRQIKSALKTFLITNFLIPYWRQRKSSKFSFFRFLLLQSHVTVICKPSSVRIPSNSCSSNRECQKKVILLDFLFIYFLALADICNVTSQSRRRLLRDPSSLNLSSCICK